MPSGKQMKNRRLNGCGPPGIADPELKQSFTPRYREARFRDPPCRRSLAALGQSEIQRNQPKGGAADVRSDGEYHVGAQRSGGLHDSSLPEAFDCDRSMNPAA